MDSGVQTRILTKATLHFSASGNKTKNSDIMTDLRNEENRNIQAFCCCPKNVKE
jgi:hypothetical protein